MPTKTPTTEKKPLVRRSRFTTSTKGIRLRPDQIEFVNQVIAEDPEQSWSRMVREGIDLVKAKHEGRIQVLVPSPR